MFDDEDNDAETMALASGRAAGSQAPSTWDERNSLPAPPVGGARGGPPGSDRWSHRTAALGLAVEEQGRGTERTHPAPRGRRVLIDTSGTTHRERARLLSPIAPEGRGAEGHDSRRSRRHLSCWVWTGEPIVVK